MKKIMSVILSIILCFSLSIPVFAATEDPNIKGFNLPSESSKADFTLISKYPSGNVSESVDSNKTVRIYTKDTKPNLESTEEETKEVLLELGMESIAVENLSNSEMKELNNSSTITATTSYIKVDENSNVSYVTEEEALYEAAKIQAKGYAGQDTIQDTYMRVWHALSYLGNGAYHVITDARWLNMPFWRSTDAIGACVQFLTITGGTQEGYYSYDTTTVTTTSTKKTSSGNIKITNVKSASDGNFYGCAGLFNLPKDLSTSSKTVKHSNLFAHFSYKGHMNFPTTTTYFNSTGTYIHVQIGVQISPSLTVTTKGSSGAISLTTSYKQEPRPVYLEILYVP